MLRIEKAILEGFIECILGHEVDIETDRMVDPAVNLGAYFSPRRTAVIIVDEIIEFGRICAVEAPVQTIVDLAVVSTFRIVARMWF
jgi:hypothetical protein